MSQNRNLHKAKSNKKDEFYTQLADIENELRHYRDHFQGKVVYCNCDDPTVSNFYRYFQLNFEFLGLKRLITTCYKSKQADMFSQHDTEQAIGVEYAGGKPQVFHLKGDGDFRSAECIELLKQADIVVTNPPFSLFREYVPQLVEHDKKFIIIGDKNAITYKEIFPLIKAGKLWVGYKTMSGGLYMDVPDHYVEEIKSNYGKGSYKIVDGVLKMFARAMWYTNLHHKRRYEELILYKKYTQEEYPHYDNYDAIEVSKTKEIPYDWPGAMGVPISFLDKHNPDQFEIMGADYDLITGQTGMRKSRFYVKGKRLYSRIVIRNKRL
ncbi:MAG: modification methylase [Chloroflexi bacterium]|nr:modification methylase [Chloroflexota bacterium]